MRLINESKKYITKLKLLKYLLYSLIALFILYIFCPAIRCIFVYYNIDPNFIVAFLTSISLVIITLQRLDDRKYLYKCEVNKSTKEKVEIVIGKLFTFRNRSELYLNTMINIRKSFRDSKKFKDINDVKSRSVFDSDIEAVGACIAMYFFDYINDDWNSMNKELSRLMTNCITLLENYEGSLANENLNLPANIDDLISESEGLNEIIDKRIQKMKDTLLKIVKDNDTAIRSETYK